MNNAKLILKLREVTQIRRDATPLSVAVDLCHKAADALQEAERSLERMSETNSRLVARIEADTRTIASLQIQLRSATRRGFP